VDCLIVGTTEVSSELLFYVDEDTLITAEFNSVLVTFISCSDASGIKKSFPK
jgi:hypothetical protein